MAGLILMRLMNLCMQAVEVLRLLKDLPSSEGGAFLKGLTEAWERANKGLAVYDAAFQAEAAAAAHLTSATRILTMSSELAAERMRPGTMRLEDGSIESFSKMVEALCETKGGHAADAARVIAADRAQWVKAKEQALEATILKSNAFDRLPPLLTDLSLRYSPSRAYLVAIGHGPAPTRRPAKRSKSVIPATVTPSPVPPAPTPAPEELTLSSHPPPVPSISRGANGVPKADVAAG